jgi:hypothetical protein
LIVPIACSLLLALPAAAPAGSGGDVSALTLSRPGVYTAAVRFFAATTERGASEKELVLRSGDLSTLRLGPNSLPIIDAQVLIANASPLRLEKIPVRVSISMGRAEIANLPAEEAIQPGAPGIQQLPFYERTYVVPEIAAGGVGRILVPDIQVVATLKEQIRQQLWPVYLRLEARIESVPGDVEIVQPSLSGFIRILPG